MDADTCGASGGKLPSPSYPLGLTLPGVQARLAVEAGAPVAQSQGTFLLKLQEEGGARTLTVRGVLFP